MVHQGRHRICRTGWLWLAGLPLAASLSARAQTAPVESVMNDTPLLADPRPWCIGRLLIDRPIASELHTEKYEYRGDRIDITSNVSSGMFQHKVNEREKEMRIKKRTNSIASYKEMLAKRLKSMIVETDTPWLEQAVSPTPDSRPLIFKAADNADLELSTRAQRHSTIHQTRDR